MSNGGYFHLIIIVMNIKSKIFNLVFWSAVLMIFYLVLQQSIPNILMKSNTVCIQVSTEQNIRAYCLIVSEIMMFCVRELIICMHQRTGEIYILA
jgi:hypothetical protein